MAHLFYLSDTNPNDATGGGGCLCSEIRTSDTEGPFVIVPSNDMESVASPHVVVCAGCLAELNRVAAGEALASGERGKVTTLPPNAPKGPDHRQYNSPAVDIDEQHKPAPRRPRKPRED